MIPEIQAVRGRTLIDSDNVRNRRVTSAMEVGDFSTAKLLVEKEGPIRAISEILRTSNLPISI